MNEIDRKQQVKYVKRQLVRLVMALLFTGAGVIGIMRIRSGAAILLVILFLMIAGWQWKSFFSKEDQP